MGSRRFNSLDVFKLIMAICVVAIHTEPLNGCKISLINEIYDSFVRMGVPFFFLASGYLMANKMKEPYEEKSNKEIVLKSLLRILKMYLLWSIIYLPLAVMHFYSAKIPPAKAAISYVSDLIFVGEHYNSWPLWYLLSTAYSLLFVMLLFRRKMNIDRLLIVAAIVMGISIAISYFADQGGELTGTAGVLHHIIINTIKSGRLLTGFFYIPLGMKLYQKKIRIGLAWMLLILGFACNVAITNTYLSTLLLVVSSVGLFCVVESIKLEDSAIYPVLRKMSTIVYLTHMYVWTAYYLLIYRKKTYGVDSFIFTSVLCCIMALMFIYFDYKRKQRVRLE